ncbi:MAG: hypothetical protein K8R58_04760, partial [Bacteroidales bacterium]|nr:hypothetical protein [Bacteroidales bacterium]
MKKTILLSISIILMFICINEIYSQPTKVIKATYFRETPPLREMELIKPGKRDRSWKDGIIRNEENIKKNREKKNNPLPDGIDPVLQNYQGTDAGGPPILNFEGVGNVNGVYPPDTEGDVGPNHYFQMINLSFAIFDKSGNLLYGPADNSTLWNGFPGPWSSTNDGDPIVLYDELADRWLASQFAINTPDGTYWQLIAISQTPDPTGAWYQYAFEFPDFNDYPKLGVWPDGYYVAFNMFGSTNRALAAVFERDLMLIGNPGARMQYFDLIGGDPQSMLPSDFDGTPPPAGTPNYFAYFNDDAWGYPNDQLRIWEFHTDWINTSNTTFTEAYNLTTEPFDSEICTAYRGRCIHQPGTSRKLESLSDRLMYRLQYRNFGTHQVMVTNHTVDVGSGHAGIRWYELRNYGPAWVIHQQGSYAPDSDHRWMGSIAMDELGYIALGYSVSSLTTYPSIRYTSRTPSSLPGLLNLAEEVIITGSGSQTGYACRWGDYSSMSLDPSDNITFWYTQEYIQTTGSANWQTRIASFQIAPPPPPPSCSTIDTPIDGATGISINGSLNWNASVDADGYKLYFGSDGGGITDPINIVPGTDLGNVLTYDYTPDGLSYNTTYYWKIIPYNAYGDATGCDIWEFTTETDPSIQTIPFIEDWETGSIRSFWTTDIPANGILQITTSDNHTASGQYSLQSTGTDDLGRTCSITVNFAPYTSKSYVRLNFWYNMLASNIINLYADIYENSTTQWHEAFHQQENYNGGIWTGWTEVSLDLSNNYDLSAGYKIKFRLQTNFTSDIENILLDDIEVSEVTFPGLWTGTIDTDWSTDSNWDDGTVPYNIDVTIPSSPPGGNFPETNSWANAFVSNLLIEAGAKLTVPAGKPLIIMNDL